MNLYDIYVLAPARDQETVQKFRARWIGPGFEPAADEYEFPQYADEPRAVFTSPEDLIKVLLMQPDEPHSVYWTNNDQGEVRTAMLFFTSDQATITGLRIEGSEVDASTYLRRLADSVGGQFGYVTGEEPPTDTAEELEAIARRADLSIIEGCK